MVDNINTNTMMGKVVAVCIAFLFIVVLAFPIANSLGNMGSGGGESEPITYTNEGLSFATMDETAQSLSIEIVNNEFVYTIDDTRIDVGFGYNASGTNTTLLMTGSYTVDDTEGQSYDGFLVLSENGYIYRYGISEGKIPDSWNLRSQGAYSETIENKMIVLSYYDTYYYFTIDKYLSNDGDIVLATNPRVTDESEIYGATTYNNTDCLITSGTITTIAENINVGDDSGESVTLSNIVLNSTPNTSYTTLESLTCEWELDGMVKQGIFDKFLVPATITIEGDSSGTDSGSDGLGNVASTLIKLVPIILIVSLLLVFIVPMVYKPN